MSSGDNLKQIAARATMLSPARIAGLETTLVVAPHPDDESLGCGGLIALLRAAGNPVHVLFVSDGTMSHPGSGKYPAPALMKLRESEALEALSVLQVEAGNVTFLRLPDARIPLPGTGGFDEAMAAFKQVLETIRPATIVLPWRRDTHPDHRASCQLVNAAVKKLQINPVMLEYPLWLWERGIDSDLPVAGEVDLYSVDISAVLQVKQEAIAAHRSQVTALIDDDPQGFRLSEEVLAHFNTSFEIFLGKI